MADLTSAERLYLDRMWRLLGIDPRSDEARMIELKVEFYTLRERYRAMMQAKRDREQPPNNATPRRGS